MAQQTPGATTQQSPTAGGSNDSALKTQKDKVSYAIGMNIGTNLHRQSVDVDPKVLQQGLEDALAGGKTLLSEDEARATLAVPLTAPSITPSSTACHKTLVESQSSGRTMSAA